MTTCAAAPTPTPTSSPTRPSVHLAGRGRRPAAHPARDARQARAGLHAPDGTHQFTPDQSDIHVLRYDQTDPGELVVPRHEKLGGDGTFNDQATDPDNPFTGNGYTSGGIPEFRTETPTTMPEGSQIWRMDSSGGQELVAVLTEYMGTKMWMPVQ